MNNVSRTLTFAGPRLVCIFVLVARIPVHAQGQIKPIRIYAAVPRPATPTSFVVFTDIRMDVDPGSVDFTRTFQVRAFRGTKAELPALGRPTADR